MLMMLTIGFILLLLACIMIILATILSKKTILDREKCSPFECGFDPKSSSRLPFSLHFFLIAIIFLIFDVEIALILPMILVLNFSNITVWLLTSAFFIFILLLGLYHEWNQGALNWTN
uniref:NADH-ubiquinone oxidoreductase chain 3 n=1 Tax=Megaselia scalaris TaxID=36166 RepID=W8EGE1_MEGSC|nr:NADH dehydrogenase subunit 3 [Megaselia scalaris]AHJ91463.1 NADH dehydrogenase subunit 3 [Megaselia scalaris]